MKTPKRGLRGLALGLAAAAALGLAVPAAHAASVVDQEQAGVGGAIALADSAFLTAQTFVAGTSGALTRVDLVASHGPGLGFYGPLTVQIWDVVGGVPGNIVASATVDVARVSMTPAWVSADFATPAIVQSGTSYAVVVSTTGSNDYYLFGNIGDPYIRGDVFVSAPGSLPWTPKALGADLAFRTYVSAPEPSYTLSGFANPVDMTAGAPKAWNTIRGGQTVPLKFEVFDAVTGVELTDTSVVASFTTTRVTCGTGTAGEDAVEIVSTGATSLTYNTAGGYFQQNWKTPVGAGTCYQVTVRTTDGSVIDQAFFEIKR